MAEITNRSVVSGLAVQKYTSPRCRLASGRRVAPPLLNHHFLVSSGSGAGVAVVAVAVVIVVFCRRVAQSWGPGHGAG